MNCICGSGASALDCLLSPCTKRCLTLECIPRLIILMVQQTEAKSLRSGSLAKAAGVSPATIRHYEKLGVLAKARRTQSGYRMYPESAVERVLVVQRALRIGFTLGELAEVLKMRDTGGAPCRRVYEMASEKLKGVRTSIQDLRRMEKYLKMVLSDWEGRVRHAAPGQRLHLLQSLSPAIKRSGEKTSRFARRQKS